MTKAEMIFPKIGIKPKQFTDTHQERCYPLTVVCDLMDEWANHELSAEREKAAKLMDAIETVITQIECCKEDHVIKSIRKVLQRSITAYKKQKEGK